jgi:putative endonuclease
MAFVYVLRSRKTGHCYTGATLNLQARLEQHNSDQSISTKHRGPWDLVHQEEYATLADALVRERFLKTGKGRDELKRLLAKDPHSAG